VLADAATGVALDEVSVDELVELPEGAATATAGVVGVTDTWIAHFLRCHRGRKIIHRATNKITTKIAIMTSMFFHKIKSYILCCKN
jgi:hypothetical protein